MTPHPIRPRETEAKEGIGSERWHDSYNRSHGGRVEDISGPLFLMIWKTLLKENNRGKREHLFRTQDTFITFLAKLRVMYSIPFRSLQGIARVLFRMTGIRSVSYTSIFRRIKRLVPHLDCTGGKPVGCAIDFTGFEKCLAS